VGDTCISEVLAHCNASLSGANNNNFELLSWHLELLYWQLGSTMAQTLRFGQANYKRFLCPNVIVFMPQKIKKAAPPEGEAAFC
jgi:hypothetical protein